MYRLHFRQELPEPVARELDALCARLNPLFDQHDEEGMLDVSTLTDTQITDLSEALSLGTSGTLRKAQIEITIDGQGSVITTGLKKVYARVPFDFEINGWEIVADQSGSIEFDIYVDSYANFPPTSADTIIGSGTPPSLSSDLTQSSSTLTGWTRDLTEGQYLEVEVISVATVTKVNLFLYGRKAN